MMLQDRVDPGRGKGTLVNAVSARLDRVPRTPLVGASIVAASMAAYSWSRFTALYGSRLPVGTLTLVAAAVLTCWAPRRFGWRWGDTGVEWRVVAASLLVVVAAVSVFRLVASPAPYALTPAEVILVPLGEEGLFRGFVLVALLGVFTRRLPRPAATRAAVIGSAVSFGVGHLGNLGAVPPGFVLFQVGVGIAFGVLAGWVRIRTSSLVGPTLLHAAMNALATA